MQANLHIFFSTSSSFVGFFFPFSLFQALFMAVPKRSTRQVGVNNRRGRKAAPLSLTRRETWSPAVHPRAVLNKSSFTFLMTWKSTATSTSGYLRRIERAFSRPWTEMFSTPLLSNITDVSWAHWVFWMFSESLIISGSDGLAFCRICPVIKKEKRLRHHLEILFWFPTSQQKRTAFRSNGSWDLSRGTTAPNIQGAFYLFACTPPTGTLKWLNLIKIASYLFKYIIIIFF